MTREEAVAWLEGPCRHSSTAEGYRREDCRACLLDALTAAPEPDADDLLESLRPLPRPGTPLARASPSPAQGEGREVPVRCERCGGRFVLALPSHESRSLPYRAALESRPDLSPAPEPERPCDCKGEKIGERCPHRPAAPEPEPLTFGVQGKDTPEVRELVAAGRGWHPGDCHPREECGTCDGTGRKPAAPPSEKEPGHTFDGGAFCSRCGTTYSARSEPCAPPSEKERTCAGCMSTEWCDGALSNATCNRPMNYRPSVERGPKEES